MFDNINEFRTLISRGLPKPISESETGYICSACSHEVHEFDRFCCQCGQFLTDDLGDAIFETMSDEQFLLLFIECAVEAIEAYNTETVFSTDFEAGIVDYIVKQLKSHINALREVLGDYE